MNQDSALDFYAKGDAFSELYELVRTVEIVMDEESYRIEVLHDHRSGRYTVRYYCCEHVTIQPTIPNESSGGQDITYGRPPEEMRIWVIDNHFPWVQRETADGALSQALGFLKDSRRKDPDELDIIETSGTNTL